MDEKLLKNRWFYSFIPIIILVIFLSILVIVEQALTPCKDISQYAICSRVIISDHILTSPVKTLDAERNLIKTKEPCKSEKEEEAAKKDSSKPTKLTDTDKDKDVKNKDVKGKECHIESRKIMGKRLGKQWVFWHWYGINIFVGIVGLIILGGLFFKSLKGSPKVAVICLILCLILGMWLSSTDSPVISDLISNTIEEADSQGGLIYIQDLINIVNFLSSTAIFFTALALFAILFRQPDSTIISEDSVNIDKGNSNSAKESIYISEHLKNLAKKLEDVRIILYVASAFLIFGMLRMSATLDWSLTFLSDDVAKITEGFLSTFTYVIGFSYTALLAAIYFPTYLLLKQKTDFFISEFNLKQEDLPENIKSKFFDISLLTSLPRITAILAPILTGFLSDFFKNFHS